MFSHRPGMGMIATLLLSTACSLYSTPIPHSTLSPGTVPIATVKPTSKPKPSPSPTTAPTITPTNTPTMTPTPTSVPSPPDLTPAPYFPQVMSLATDSPLLPADLVFSRNKRVWRWPSTTGAMQALSPDTLAVQEYRLADDGLRLVYLDLAFPDPHGRSTVANY